MRIPVLHAFVLASACAPIPMTPDRAERQCAERAGLADGVAGSIQVGVGSGGSHSGASITLTRQIFSPQTEDEFMVECIGRLLEGESGPTEVGVSAGQLF